MQEKKKNVYELQQNKKKQKQQAYIIGFRGEVKEHSTKLYKL